MYDLRLSQDKAWLVIHKSQKDQADKEHYVVLGTTMDPQFWDLGHLWEHGAMNQIASD